MAVADKKRNELDEQNQTVIKELESQLLDSKKKLSAGNINDALSTLKTIQSTLENLHVSDKVKTHLQNLSTEVQYLIAVSYRLLKKSTEAISVLNNLIYQTRSYARAHQELGYNFLDKHEFEKALDAFLSAVMYNPVLISSWTKLHQIIINSPKTTLANRKLNGQTLTLDLVEEKLKSLATIPTDVINATDLLFENKMAQAEELVRKYLQKKPHQPDAMALLAEIGIKNKVYDDAEFILTTGVELHPNHFQLRFQLIGLLMKLGKYSAAIAHIDSNKWPKNNTFTNVLATHRAIALSNLGKSQEALQAFEHLDKQHTNEDVLIQWGHALKYAGQFDDAVCKYKEAYKKNSHCGDAYWSLANTKRYVFEPVEIENMKVLVNSEDVSVKDKTHAHFALGKALEDQSRFKESFEHYEKGNALKSSDVSYLPGSTEDLTKQLMQACTPEWARSIKTSLSSSATPIFIVGLPRAGSTLVEQILASHSKVEGTSELHNILSIALKLKGKSNLNQTYPNKLTQLSLEERQKLGEHYLINTEDYRTNKPFFIDKMPNNFLHIGLIKSILPNAKIIDARREPMACCFSGFKQLFGDGQDFSYDLEWIGRYYKSYLKIMEHWQTIFPNQIFTVQHEELIENTDGVIEQLLNYCGLDIESQCKRFYENKRTVLTPSSEQVRQPIYKNGMNQWRNYEPFLGTLKNALK